MGGTARGPGLGSMAWMRSPGSRASASAARLRPAVRACKRGGPGAWFCGWMRSPGSGASASAARLRPAVRASAEGPGLGSVAGCVRRETGRPLRHPASAGRACQRGGPGAWLCGLDAFAGKQGVRFATRLRPAARASAEGPGNGRRTCRAAALPAAVRPLCAAALPAATRPLCSAALPAATRPLRAAPSASVCPHALAALVASAKARPSVFVLLFKMFRPLLTRQSTYAMIWMAFRKAAARCTCSRIRAGITSLTRNHIFSALCPPNRIWKRIEVVITGLTRNQVVRKGSWVRIPPLPPPKDTDIDTMSVPFLFTLLNCIDRPCFLEDGSILTG